MKQFFARQWLRFCTAAQFITLLNFIMLSYALFGKSCGIYVTSIAVMVAWLIGWFLLDGLKFSAALEREATARSPIWEKVFDKLERIEKLHEGTSTKTDR